MTEAPEPEVKQNLFNRVTGTLSLKKAGLAEPTFGVKTAGNPGTGSNEEMQDDFFQQRLGTEQLGLLKSEPKPKESSLPAEGEPVGNSIVPASEDANKLNLHQSKVTAPDSIVQAWKDDDLPQERLDVLDQLDDSSGDSKRSEKHESTALHSRLSRSDRRCLH